MATYITVAEVRRTCGISDSDISDADMGYIIDEIEDQTPRFLNTAIVPTQKIEFRDGDGTNRIVLYKNPVLSVRELKIDGTSITIDGNLNIERPSGFIELDSVSGSPEYALFKQKSRSVIVKYLYGLVDETSTSTTTTADSTAGTSVDLAVADETDFAENDWVDIYGMDGKQEVAQITATASNQITVDQLVHTHESGSTVVKMEVNETIKRLMRIAASISAVARIIGQSSTDTTGYTLGELSVQKGEPYTQWRETATQLIRERDEILERIKIRFSIQ